MNQEKENYNIERHDLTKDKSLKAWNAADEYLLKHYNELTTKPERVGIYNDRFGYLSCHLHSDLPTVIATNKGQEKAIKLNFEANNLRPISFSNPLSGIDNKLDYVSLKLTKSLDLFRLFLEHIIANSSAELRVTCAFMTRNFSPNFLQIANDYFDVVEQSRALKKARLLILSKKKETTATNTITTLTYKNQEYKQYLGVFSADHIDYATQFFLKHIELKQTDTCILDLASGNGIIGNEIFKLHPSSEIHLMDDSVLAVSSAQLNIQGENIHHHFNNELSDFAENFFDLIVTNPPFHFEYEINIEIPIQLFKDCFRCLKEGGNLQIVANKHLNYKVHLEPVFSAVQVLAEDKKFVVYKCIK